jgi:hypothetical protein
MRVPLDESLHPYQKGGGDMGVEEILFFIFLFLAIVLPVLGLTARLTLRPLVDVLLRLKEVLPQQRGGDQDARLANLELEVQKLRQEIKALREADSFHQELLRGQSDAPLKPADPNASTSGT